MCYHPHVESKRNVSMQEEQTHRHREEGCGCQGGGKDWSLGWADEIYLHIKWINTQILQYGTGDSFQYLVIKYNGKEYMCQAESVLLYRRHELTSTNTFTFKNVWFIYLQWNITWQWNVQTEMTKNTDLFWNMILRKYKEILRRVTVLLLHYIHNDQEETRFIT